MELHASVDEGSEWTMEAVDGSEMAGPCVDFVVKWDGKVVLHAEILGYRHRVVFMHRYRGYLVDVTESLGYDVDVSSALYAEGVVRDGRFENVYLVTLACSDLSVALWVGHSDSKLAERAMRAIHFSVCDEEEE